MVRVADVGSAIHVPGCSFCTCARLAKSASRITRFDGVLNILVLWRSYFTNVIDCCLRSVRPCTRRRCLMGRRRGCCSRSCVYASVSKMMAKATRGEARRRGDANRNSVYNNVVPIHRITIHALACTHPAAGCTPKCITDSP